MLNHMTCTPIIMHPIRTLCLSTALHSLADEGREQFVKLRR